MGLRLKCDNCGSSSVMSPDGGETYVCVICGYVYRHEPVDGQYYDDHPDSDD